MHPQEPRSDDKTTDTAPAPAPQRGMNRREKRALKALSRSKRALKAYQNRTKTPTGES